MPIYWNTLTGVTQLASHPIATILLFLSFMLSFVLVFFCSIFLFPSPSSSRAHSPLASSSSPPPPFALLFLFCSTPWPSSDYLSPTTYICLEAQLHTEQHSLAQQHRTVFLLAHVVDVVDSSFDITYRRQCSHRRRRRHHGGSNAPNTTAATLLM